MLGELSQNHAADALALTLSGYQQTWYWSYNTNRMLNFSKSIVNLYHDFVREWQKYDILFFFLKKLSM